jgi:hypothetical protein
VRSSKSEPLDPNVISQLEPGKTTALEATNLLGGPSQVVDLGSRSAYLYDHSLTKGSGFFLIPFIVASVDARGDRLWLFFDSEQVLTHYGATFTGHRPQYAFPWWDLHQDWDQKEMDKERPGITPGKVRMGGGYVGN